ncbi:MAG: hypothetical protein ABI624_16515 [Casimicrobiaceae bacterium]
MIISSTTVVATMDDGASQMTPSMRKQAASPPPADTPMSRRKAALDVLLLALPGVSARTIHGLDAYFTADKMFACISGDGVGLRLPIATATNLQFARDDVVSFQPGGMASTREWIQINRSDASGYEKDLALFQAAADFVKSGQTR